MCALGHEAVPPIVDFIDKVEINYGGVSGLVSVPPELRRSETPAEDELGPRISVGEHLLATRFTVAGDRGGDLGALQPEDLPCHRWRR